MGPGRRASGAYRATTSAYPPAGTKQISWLSGFPATGSPHREADGRQLLLGEAREDVGLVLVAVRAAQEPDAARRVARHPGVVARRQEVHPEPPHALEEERELDGAVAGDAGVRRPTAGVLAGEVPDDLPLELLPEVQDVVADPQGPGD